MGVQDKQPTDTDPEVDLLQAGVAGAERRSRWVSAATCYTPKPIPSLRATLVLVGIP